MKHQITRNNIAAKANVKNMPVCQGVNLPKHSPTSFIASGGQNLNISIFFPKGLLFFYYLIMEFF
jgi:hypothetical protein